MRIAFVIAAVALAGCPEGGASKQAQPPVIVVQAPTDANSAKAADAAAAAAGGTGYAGLAWEAVNTVATNQGNDPDAEPYDVVSTLREHEPQLTDPPNDQAGTNAYDDLLSALAVMDEEYLYVRVGPRAPMAGDQVRELRFWIEQAPNMATVEVKVGTRGRPCELADIKLPDGEQVVDGCFWLGTAVDLRIPLAKIPPSIDTKKPYWVSGFQTCCQDEERSKPWDAISEAQEVWRMPGKADEVDAP